MCQNGSLFIFYFNYWCYLHTINIKLSIQNWYRLCNVWKQIILQLDDCVLANTKLYHRNLLLLISMKFWILVSTTLGLFSKDPPIYPNTHAKLAKIKIRSSLGQFKHCSESLIIWSLFAPIHIKLSPKVNKATRSPEISREQVQKLTPQCLLYIYIGYRFPLSLSTIWGNHLPVKFPTCISTILEKLPPPFKHEENIKWEIIVFYSQIVFSRNVGNNIKCEKTLHPPPQTTPTFAIQNQNKGIEDIMDKDSNCPYLLFGETTSHLTSKLKLLKIA